jgi:hypothetical protein
MKAAPLSERDTAVPKSKPIPWRDILPIHPTAEALPLLSPEALRELAEDIKRNGLREVPVYWNDPETFKAMLLDGRNRLDAIALIVKGPIIEMAKDPYNPERPPSPRFHRAVADELRCSDGWGHVPHIVSAWLGGNERVETSADPVAYVISANLVRRHLRPRDLVRHAMAVRHAARGGGTVPIAGVERRDGFGVLRQTRPSVRLSVGGRGHKGEASEIAEQTGVPVRTVRRVIAEQKPRTIPVVVRKAQPTGPADLREEAWEARKAAEEARRGLIRTRLFDAALARCAGADAFDTVWTLVGAALDGHEFDRYEWADVIVSSWASTAAILASAETKE